MRQSELLTLLFCDEDVRLASIETLAELLFLVFV